MCMAAAGSNHKERHLAQPPESVRAAVACRRKLRAPYWVAAVMLMLGLSLLLSPIARSYAGATLALSAAADTGAPVVPILFPLEERISWVDTFGAARSGGRTHAGNDLMAPKMTPLLAVVDGTVDWLNLTGKPSSYNNLPYYNILLRGDDGNDYFYVHLNNDTPGTDDGQGGVQYAYAPGLVNGMRVKCGDVIGYVGDSGNAEDTGSHLHFEIHLGGYVSASAGQTRTPSAIDPYASLKAAVTLEEWIAAGRPPLAAATMQPGATTTTKPPSTTTTVKPSTTTTTAANPATTTTTTAPGNPTTTTTSEPADTRVDGFTDVFTTDWFYPDFAQALEAGVVTKASDERFRPYSKVTRALFAAYLVRVMAPSELTGSTESTPMISAGGSTGTTTSASAETLAGTAAHTSTDVTVGALGIAADQAIFTDVPASYWAYEEIQVAARLGLVRGTGDGSTFSPDQLVTRAQMAAMICRAMGSDPDDDWAGAAAPAYLLFKDVPEGYWAQGSVVMVQYLGLMCGDTQDRFRPEENTTRAQAITVMARLLRLLEGGSGS